MMIWYGLIYYVVFNFLIITFLMYIFKLQNFFHNLTSTLINPISNFFLTFILFISLLVSLIINNLHIIPNHLNLGSLPILPSYNYYNMTSKFYYNFDSYLNLLQVYYYPYIYIFLIVTSLSIIYTLTYSYNELQTFMAYLMLIFFAGLILFFTNSLVLFFFAYEALLVPSFFILYKFAKTRRCVEAAYLMFFWTQFGALFLIILFLYLFLVTGSTLFSAVENFYYSPFEINFFFITLILGFGVKLPIWPFYGWLPKAHVEASTNFSIFLSGVLVKFAFFGLFKILLLFSLEPSCIYVYPFLFIGIADSVLKLFYQIDLKKLVAYSTVVEMHWLTICIISGQSNLLLSGFCMLISHALLSSNSFLLVDAVARRFKTRLITEISGINFLTPKLFLVILLNLLIFLGFPGTLFFIAEFLFFSFMFDLFPLLAFLLMVLLYLLAPTFFFKSWMNAIFGNSNFLLNKLPMDLTSREFLVFMFIIYLMFAFAFSWQSFLF
uniref:NADH-ubiquinone oxidoreductase chain 4 n=1 Tax=Strombidium cf. sulcatum TaxID=2793073 RepID=A0A7T0M4R6_9SPIT|nr:NADH dehydrogenase subunit 4 [Strombidium cf. sulcatum]QPL15956.1 NADH dehydrogenase subunit 4 [Strombidium cf. sulcatum]